MQGNFLKLWVLLTTLLKIMRCHYCSSYGTYVRLKVWTAFGTLKMVHKNEKSLVVHSSLAPRLPRNLEVHTINFILFSEQYKNAFFKTVHSHELHQFFFLFVVLRPSSGCWAPLIRLALWSHSLDIPHLAGLLWMSDQPNAESSTWQHTTLTRDKHPWPQRDSNSQS